MENITTNKEEMVYSPEQGDTGWLNSAEDLGYQMDPCDIYNHPCDIRHEENPDDAWPCMVVKPDGAVTWLDDCKTCSEWYAREVADFPEVYT